jgi:ABC-type polysaccharide/polyol phosphate export permease
MQALTLAWFYLTPVIYPLSMVPSGFIGIFGLNPMVGIISLYRYVLLGASLPPAAALVSALIWPAVLIVSGIIIFKKREPLFADWI